MASSTRSSKPSKAAVEQFCAVTGRDFRYWYIILIISSATVTVSFWLVDFDTMNKYKKGFFFVWNMANMEYGRIFRYLFCFRLRGIKQIVIFFRFFFYRFAHGIWTYHRALLKEVSVLCYVMIRFGIWFNKCIIEHVCGLITLGGWNTTILAEVIVYFFALQSKPGMCPN
jgi:hypothetical protein